MNKDNGGGVLGRIIALTLIVGAAFGARAISRGTFACGSGAGGCCLMEISAAADAQPAAAAPAPVAAPVKAETK
jgi:hypothetical protein